MPHTYTALPVNSVSVTTPAKKIMYHPWNLGAKSFFFHDLEGLAPSPYVEPPLPLAALPITPWVSNDDDDLCNRHNNYNNKIIIINFRV